jgi:YVTN family beta-propeller protein
MTKSRIALTLVLTVVALLFTGCGGGATESSNPPPSNGSQTTPTISSLSPSSIVAGGAGFTLTVNGTNFVAGSAVSFNGSAPVTTFVSPTKVTAAIPAASIGLTGKVAVTVTTPAPSGGVSNAIDFAITTSGGGSGGANPSPAISIIFPNCGPAGEEFIDGTDNLLTVVGNGFVANSVVRWNGSDRPTSSNGTINAVVAQIQASDIATAGTASVTVFNPAPGGGTSNSVTYTATAGAGAPQSITLDPAGKFAYVVEGGCGGGIGAYVSTYTVDPTTGALTSTGPPVSANGYGVGYGATSIAVDPFGKFAYVANAGDLFDYDNEADGIAAMFSINSATGALTSAGTITGVYPGGPCCFNAVAVDPSGRFAYMTNGGVNTGGVNLVSAFTIDSTSGALTSIGTAATGDGPSSVAIGPGGKFAYVANFNSNNVSMYTINGTSGALTSVGTIAAGADPASMTVDPTGKFAYVTNQDSNDVSMYTIDPTSGALTSIGTVAAGKGPVSVAVDPASKFAYVTNLVSNDVSMYTVGTGGTLTPLGTIAAGTNPTSVVVHPSGGFVYVTNVKSNDISVYSIDPASGLLTLVGTIGS